jgi:hypothetical protein
MITVTLMKPGADNTEIEIEEETTVEQFLSDQGMAGTVYKNAAEAGPEDVLEQGDKVLVIANKAVKGA